MTVLSFFFFSLRIYDFQDAGQSYTDIEGIMAAMGGEEFEGWLTKPISVILRDMGLSERFVQEFAAIATRANYGQNPNMMGFAGKTITFQSSSDVNVGFLFV